MLDQFQIPAGEEVRIDQAVMRSTVEAVFRKLGMSDEHARQSADVLIYADLRGYDTHGVSNMLRVYVQYFKDGNANPEPAWQIVRERKAVATIDSGGAHGGVIGPAGMRLAIARPWRLAPAASDLGPRMRVPESSTLAPRCQGVASAPCLGSRADVVDPFDPPAL